ncbi:MAG: hypothetical protein MJY60_07920 [Bacteroidales bacterium]|nr:hypothetical protein [Bacteroidales bacterium]
MNRTVLSAMAVICSAVAVSCGSQKRCGNNSTGEMTTTEEEIGIPVKTVDAEDGLVGLWDAIRMTADTLSFGKEGGEQTVICLNYDKWWLNDIKPHNSEKYWHADPGRNNEYMTAKAPGISAEIIRPNTVRVKVEPSDNPASWDIHLESGDAFTSITVIQK